MLSEEGSEVALALNSRWLTSICDTVVDTADNDTDRAAGLIGVIFVNTIKMGETDLRLYRPARDWPPTARMRHGGEIYDGVQTLWTGTRGDVDNIFMRIERGLEINSSVKPVLEQLIFRAIEGDNFVGRIIGLTGRPQLPIVPPRRLARLARVMKGL